MLLQFHVVPWIMWFLRIEKKINQDILKPFAAHVRTLCCSSLNVLQVQSLIVVFLLNRKQLLCHTARVSTATFYRLYQWKIWILRTPLSALAYVTNHRSDITPLSDKKPFACFPATTSCLMKSGQHIQKHREWRVQTLWKTVVLIRPHRMEGRILLNQR